MNLFGARISLPSLRTIGVVVFAITLLLVLSQALFPEIGQAQTNLVGVEPYQSEAEAKAPAQILDPVVGVLTDIPGKFLTVIVGVFLTIATFFLGLVGVVFNFVVIRTVFQFGEFFGTSDAMLVAWGIIRDISNIGLLFAFIFLGVMLILNVGGGGHGGINAKKAVPRLILFAALLNFSLFASQAVIDVANAFASSFANLAGEECASTSQADGPALAECASKGISGRIIQVAGIGTIWADGGKGLRDNVILGTNSYSYAASLLMLSLFALITAAVLGAGAIMLIIRVVTLTFLMITSPIGFAGMVIPKMEPLAKMWWSKLISQAFFAPVYLLLILISVKMTEGMMSGSATLAGALLAQEGIGFSGGMQVVMVFLIVVGFMLGSVILANKFGAIGASFAMNTASAFVFGGTARLSNLAAGGAARGLRGMVQGVGRDGKAGVARRLTTATLKSIENTNLDTRRFGVGAALSMAGATTAAKQAGHATFGEQMHDLDEAKVYWTKVFSGKQYDDDVKFAELEKTHGDLSGLADARDYLRSLSLKKLKELHDVSAFANDMSDAQISSLLQDTTLDDRTRGKLLEAYGKNLVKKAQGLDPYGAATEPMTLAQLEAAVTNKNLTTPVQDEIREKYLDTLVKNIDTITTAGFDSAVTNKNFSAAEKDRVRTAYVDSIKTRVGSMTAEALDSVSKNKNLTPADIESIRAERFAGLDTAVTALTSAGTSATPALIDAVKSEVRNLNKKELLLVPAAVLAQAAYLDALSDAQRDEYIASDSRTKAEKDLVRASYAHAKISEEYKKTIDKAAAAKEVVRRIKDLNEEQVSKIDPDILADKEVSSVLTPGILNKINNQKLTTAQREAIGKNVRDLAKANPQLEKYLKGPQGSMW